MTEKFPIIIVGGGVCGLSCALSLINGGVKEVIVLEKGTHAKLTGAQYNLWQNGIQALRHIVGPENFQLVGGTADSGGEAACGQAVDHFTYFQSMGPRAAPRLLRRLPAPNTGVNLSRTDLFSRQLLPLLPKNAIHYNKQVVSVAELVDRVVVRCADGSEFVGSGVVGADGINSQVRSLLVPDARVERAPFTAIGGAVDFLDGHGSDWHRHQATMAPDTAPFAAEAASLGLSVDELLSADGRGARDCVQLARDTEFRVVFADPLIFICCSAGGGSNGRLTWIVAVRDDVERSQVPHGDLALCSVDDWRHWIQGELARALPVDHQYRALMRRVDWANASSTGLAVDQRADGFCFSATANAPVLWRVYDLNPLASLIPPNCRRTVLVGDAAHALLPTVGMGANMALEDGCALGLCVRCFDSIPDAFAAFNRFRLARCHELFHFARADWRSISNSTWVAGLLRNLYLSYLPEFMLNDKKTAAIASYNVFDKCNEFLQLNF